MGARARVRGGRPTGGGEAASSPAARLPPAGPTPHTCAPRLPPPPRRSYILAYNSHHLKDTFNVHSLDLKAVARSFGFAQPPRVNINIESKAAHTRKAQKGQGADYRRQKSGALGCAGSRGARVRV